MMNAIFQEADLVMVSDVHLRSQEDPRSQRLLELMTLCADQKVKNFILLGDIFEFFVGSSPYFQKKFSYLWEELRALAASGCKVYFFEGNHEFHLAKVKPVPGLEIVAEGNREIEIRDGQKSWSLVCSHGDLVYSNLSYRLFRAFVKSKPVHLLAKLIPQVWLDSYAMAHAKVSRASDYLRTLDHVALRTAFSNWKVEYPRAKLGLFGHFHTPLLWEDQLIFAAGPSWTSPSALIVRQGKLYRSTLPTSEGTSFCSSEKQSVEMLSDL